MQTSNYNRLDYLNTLQATTTSPTTQQKSTKFGSVLNSINGFLNTATSTAVTIDGIINGQGQSGNNSGNSLTPAQQMALVQAQKKASKPNYALIGGAVAVAGGAIYMFTRKKGK